MPPMSFLPFAVAAIALTLNAYFAVTPATVMLMVRLEPDAHNRVVCIAYDSGEWEGSSCWTVDGVNAPKAVQRFYRDLPAGNYVVEAWVLRDDGSRKDATPHVVRVTGPN